MGQIAHLKMACALCGKWTSIYVEETGAQSARVKCEHCGRTFEFGAGMQYSPVGYVPEIPHWARIEDGKIEKEMGNEDSEPEESVIPCLIDGSDDFNAECSVCGTKQRRNRSVCFKCGVVFNKPIPIGNIVGKAAPGTANSAATQPTGAAAKPTSYAAQNREASSPSRSPANNEDERGKGQVYTWVMFVACLIAALMGGGAYFIIGAVIIGLGLLANMFNKR